MTRVVGAVKQTVMSLGGVAAVELFLKERNKRRGDWNEFNHCRCLMEVATQPRNQWIPLDMKIQADQKVAPLVTNPPCDTQS